MSNVHLFFLLLLLPFHEECSASHSPQKLFFQSVSSGPIVDTVYGKVQGTYTDSAKVFRSIPYASPPVDNLRWQSPIPPKPWSGILQTTADPPGCPQPVPCRLPKMVCPLRVSEDCLFLNVFTPLNAQSSSKLPVMVFIPGGAFETGYGGGHLFDGQYIVNNTNVILVSINYRLGAIGFLVYREGSGAVKGNYGIQDQRLALQWVQRNIAQFGGDPTAVTIFGQSAGAISVALHMATNRSKGLFSKAILESEPFGISIKDVTDAKKFGEDFAKELGCAKDNTSCVRGKGANLLLAHWLGLKWAEPVPMAFDLWPATFDLRGICWSIRYPLRILIPYNHHPFARDIATHEDAIYLVKLVKRRRTPLPDIVAAQMAVGKKIVDYSKILELAWTPCADGDEIPNNPLQSFTDGKLVSTVPMMIGTVAEETVFFIYEAIRGSLSALEYDAFVAALFPFHFISVLKEYPPSSSSSDQRLLAALLLTDYTFACPTRLATLAYLKTTQPVWLYMFDHPLSYDGWGANFSFCNGHSCHGVELPFVFHTAPLDGFHYTPDELVLSDTLINYWTNFARYGNPNGKGDHDARGIGKLHPQVLSWPEYTTDKEPFLHFKTPRSEVGSFYNKEHCDFLDTIGYND